MGRFIATKIILVLAILSLIWSLLVLMVSFGYALDPTIGGETDPGTIDFILLVCNPVCMLITASLWVIWYIRKKRENAKEDLVAYINLYRNISLTELASKMNMPVKQVEAILLDCVSENLVSGHIDKSTGEFILENSD